MKTKWKSIAYWDKGVSTGNSKNVSVDTHSTEEMAQAVADALLIEGLGGERKIFPIKTRVEKVIIL
ncbi:MAG: hypothetical protein DRN27_10035 [Thermoplasmata archaeon]|nr:MAG: hypothetical protein DRN27_10035 [Thermoplasmata archaeon]